MQRERKNGEIVGCAAVGCALAYADVGAGRRGTIIRDGVRQARERSRPGLRGSEARRPNFPYPCAIEGSRWVGSRVPPPGKGGGRGTRLHTAGSALWSSAHVIIPLTLLAPPAAFFLALAPLGESR